jgi:O-antigen/teichoic acid export membrane protein
MSTQPPADSGAVSREAALIASGGGIVFAGSLIDKALRLLIGLFLSRMFGAAAYGVYVYVVKVITIIAVAAPMGLDISMVFFGARFRRSGDLDKLKGTFILGFAMTSASAVLLMLAAYAAISTGVLGRPEYRESLLILTPVVAIMPVMLFLVSCLRSFRDMRSNALAFQIVLPGSLLIGLLVSVGLLGGGVDAALRIFVLSQLLGLITAAALMWRHYGPLIQDRSLIARFSPLRQLSYSIPQGLMGIVFRLNTWMDVLMLGWLSTDREVGLYSIAASLALLGVLPAVSLNTMFNPVISELVQARELVQLNRLLQIITRWLLLICLPFFSILLLVPDGILLIYGADFEQSRTPLLVLVLGQIIWVTFAPTMRIIPMSGHSLLNLINGLVALVLSLGLNYLLIPRYGGTGAAVGTAITLGAWSLWRLVEVYHLFRCFPFSRRTMLVGGVCSTVVGSAVWLTLDSPLSVRLIVVAVFLPAYAAFAYAFGRSPDDALVTARLRKRLSRLLGR